jgi:hypothetical protein
MVAHMWDRMERMGVLINVREIAPSGVVGVKDLVHIGGLGVWLRENLFMIPCFLSSIFHGWSCQLVYKEKMLLEPAAQ